MPLDVRCVCGARAHFDAVREGNLVMLQRALAFASEHQLCVDLERQRRDEEKEKNT